jgi:hypothetical protein
MMSLRRAPRALRTPISRVRSATATSMMFMITIDPTMSPMAGSAVPNASILLRIPSKKASADCDVSKAKLSGSPGPSRRRARIVSRATSWYSPRSSSEGALTIRPSTSPRGLVTRRIGELNGATASRSSEKPNTLPCRVITPTTVYGTPAMRSSRPTGLSAGKKCLATSSPITTTGVPSRASCSVNARPADRSYCLMRK